MDILSTQNLSVGYRKNEDIYPVIENLNVNLKAGSLVSLIGANGIGKSTLLRTLAGSQKPLKGKVLIDGNDISRIPRHKLANLLSMVYTDRTQAGGLTAREIVGLGRQPHTGFLGRMSSHDREVIESAMKSAGIIHKANSFLAELSDGERQKVMIAKALAQETPLIILDEPTAFLDVASRAEAMILLHDLAHKFNKAILLSSHDLSQSILLADELWVVSSSRTLLCGNTEDIILSGAMDEMFDTSRIEFDLKIGDFKVNLPAKMDVNLICPNNILCHWITNALNRNGFNINKNASLKISVQSSSDISLESANGCCQVNSIAELVTSLKKAQ